LKTSLFRRRNGRRSWHRVGGKDRPTNSW
jgi:hypothetical protein